MKESLYIILIFLLFACKRKDFFDEKNTLNEHLNLPTVPFDYESVHIPPHLNRDWIKMFDNTKANNPISNEGATLGRVLFYDKSLSQNNTVSCASCHQQEVGFSDTKQFSVGFAGGITKRHSMGLTNARFRNQGIYFWDGRSPSVEHQVLQPIQDSVEMGMLLTTLIAKLSKKPYYPILFKDAFGSEEITTQKISFALAQFIHSMLSFNSRYDEGRINDSVHQPFSNFTSQENLGKELFFDVQKGNCGGCHHTDAFLMDSPRNNGLDVWETSTSNDIGYEAVTGNPLDKGKFTAPSLRNIAIRPPYMHDGRFETLQEVLDHYSTNIKWSETLDDHLKSGPSAAKQFNLSQVEKDAIIAFLYTLTDQSFLTDKKYSNPFK